jgi:hypothetical protein
MLLENSYSWAVLPKEKNKTYQLILDLLMYTDKLFIDKMTPVEKSLPLSLASLVVPVGMQVFEQSYHLLSKEQLDDDGSERRVEADGDSEQEQRVKPPTDQEGDGGPGASVELNVKSDRLQEHNDDEGYHVDNEIESDRAGLLDPEEITTTLGGPCRPDGDETADEESVAAIFRRLDENPTGLSKANALKTVVEEEKVVEVLQHLSSGTHEFSLSCVEAGYEAEDSQGHTEEDEEVSEAMQIEDEEEERLQVGDSRRVQSAASADTQAEQRIRRPDTSTLSDMDLLT